MKMNNLLNEEEILLKTTRYELERDGSRVFIDIKEIIAHTVKETTPVKFLGVPHLCLGGTKEKYIVTADTAEEALAKCLAVLKDADFLDVPEETVTAP